MKLFVTGGSGFVGSHFVAAAMLRGHEVTALRRATSAPRIVLTHEPRWVTGDLATVPGDAMAGHDVLVHLAAHSPNTPYDSLERCIQGNVTDSLRCLRAANEHGVRRFLVAGSCFEYGYSANDFDCIPSNAPLRPAGSYPTSKAMASLAVREFIRETGSVGMIARLFQVYGEGEAESRLWPALRAAAAAGRDFPMSPGEQLRDFVRVDQVAEMLVMLAERIQERKDGGIEEVNIASGVTRSVADFARECWREWHATGRLLIGALPYKDNEMMRVVPELTPDAFARPRTAGA
ncbi:MAG: NAD-dependent epimerase/dehydratase family protein [Gemmatimonadetes bacterium]|nr:NAD-dependent epimerase/dehydratase family protein [Gemmatimonadota bacterium]